MRSNRWFRVCGIAVVQAATTWSAALSADDQTLKTQIAAGAGVMIAPRYPGSSRYEVLPLPYFDVSDGGVEFNGIDDVRLRLFGLEHVEGGVITGYARGRQESDSPRLKGLGDITDGVVGGAFVRYREGPFSITGSYSGEVMGEDTGSKLSLDGELDLPITDWASAYVSADITYGDSHYMSANFGITPLQSMKSGLAAFDASAGLANAGIEAGVAVDFAASWRLFGSLRYERLLNDAAASPIVDTPNQAMATLGLAYTFDVKGF